MILHFQTAYQFNSTTIKVLTFGTFDHLHEGHKYFLQTAKKYGNELITIIALDETVKKVKGFYPDHNQDERRQAVENLKISNTVALGNPGDKYQVIADYKPDIICLGYDQIAFTESLNEILRDLHLNTKIVRIESHFPEKFKSSYLRKSNESNHRKH